MSKVILALFLCLAGIGHAITGLSPFDVETVVQGAVMVGVGILIGTKV